jgi:hypothetical protein
MIKESNDAITVVSTAMQASMVDFASVFAKFPDKHDDKVLETILGVLSSFIGVGTGFIWNSGKFLP